MSISDLWEGTCASWRFLPPESADPNRLFAVVGRTGRQKDIRGVGLQKLSNAIDPILAGDDIIPGEPEKGGKRAGQFCLLLLFFPEA